LFKKTVDVKEVLVKNSRYPRITAKRAIIDNGLLEYKCSICGIGGLWNGHDLTLVLDHINGINNDHSIQNLRFLCPNCNSQTATFSGRNVKREVKHKYCSNCGNEISIKSHKEVKLCRKCSRSTRIIGD
jgi:5-methylcytosine-specific restriction endonuclease McrA